MEEERKEAEAFEAELPAKVRAAREELLKKNLLDKSDVALAEDSCCHIIHSIH